MATSGEENNATRYHAASLHRLGAPDHLIPWCNRWDMLCGDLIQHKQILINLGVSGARASWTSILSHHGGIHFGRWLQPYSTKPLDQWIHWKVNGEDYADAGNATYRNVMICFLDQIRCPTLNRALERLNANSLGNILETILGAYHVLRGDVVTGVAKLPPEMVQRVAETFPSTEVLADLVEIVSRMVTVVVYVGHYAGNLQVPIRDLLL